MKMPSMAIAAVAATISLTACVSPTPFQNRADGRGQFGYTSTKVDDALIRVEFQGNGRTAQRAIDAYVLYRAAELAKDGNAPAFMVLEGNVDREILDGEDRFTRVDGRPFESEDMGHSTSANGDGPADRVVDSTSSLVTLKTAGLGSGGFRMPAPVYVPKASIPATPKSYVPTYIYTGNGQVNFPQRSLLIRLLQAVPAETDAKSYVTQEVLAKLGPRIVRKPA
jgi:hypothetical protein